MKPADYIQCSLTLSLYLFQVIVSLFKYSVVYMLGAHCSCLGLSVGLDHTQMACNKKKKDSTSDFYQILKTIADEDTDL
ncbi:hypothetical protein IGI04_025826 [Brassica rapa subsp. trilocularis]|uniref:Uncharacterized protein n=1 Tax=Brassica rapa subsp. trilocularis TaxID=1813537 RepID=A0ABQ7KKK4_BRACM|nr:hypothetical protein IGI04_042994 [Brassica rapa subsp. trilocularis]KAG5377983.1 hypothetical protein IGI04_025826 [Brassica rapa subsp. trilocularis]